MPRVEEFATREILELVSSAGYQNIAVAKHNGTVPCAANGETISGLPSAGNGLADEGVQRK
jgi:hypothetical protein